MSKVWKRYYKERKKGTAAYITTTLEIDYRWKTWKPAYGQYAGKNRIICKTISPKRGLSLNMPSGSYILANITDGAVTCCHLAEITNMVVDTSAIELIKDEEVIKLLNSEFNKYKAKWEEKRRVIKAVELLKE